MKGVNAKLHGDGDVGKVSNAKLHGDGDVGKVSNAKLRGDGDVGKVSDAKLRGDGDVGKVSDAKLRGDVGVGKVSDAKLRGDGGVGKVSDAKLRGDAGVGKVSKVVLRGDVNVGKVSKVVLRGDVDVGKVSKVVLRGDVDVEKVSKVETVAHGGVCNGEIVKTHAQRDVATVLQGPDGGVPGVVAAPDGELTAQPNLADRQGAERLADDVVVAGANPEGTELLRVRDGLRKASGAPLVKASVARLGSALHGIDAEVAEELESVSGLFYAEAMSEPSPSNGPDALTRLYRACDPRVALEPDDPRYVNCDEVRGANVVQVFARALRLSNPEEPEVKIFAGHRGVGKTSELLRLKHALEEKTEDRLPFKVLFFDVSRSLDLNDLDFPDLLVFVAGELQKKLAAAKIPGFTATSQYLSRLWDDLTELLGSHLSLSGAKTEVPYAQLAVEIRNQPSARTQLRQAIEQQSTALIDAVNDLLVLARVELRKVGYEGLVLIVDGLDKVVRRDLDGGSNTHDRIFIHRSEQLASLSAHVVYTVPISLIYSPQFTQLEQTLGEHHAPVPMIRLRDGSKDDAGNGPGIAKMREMVDARCRFADVDFNDVFEKSADCDEMCRLTGGHPRHLMMFMQAAINGVDRLPVTRDAIDRAVDNYANSLLRGIPDDCWPALRRFAKPQEQIPKDAMHQEMLLLLYVFEYMNGRPWYEVNPVIRRLKRFRAVD